MRLPAPARLVFRRGVLCYLAVETAWGPHLTPVVYSESGGRLWVTTSRRSVKARAWRRDGSVAGLVDDGETAVTFRGRVTRYDAFDPFSWPESVMAGPRLLEAGARFTLKNARFFAGYAVDARRVPLAWTPPGRVFVAVRPWEGRILGSGDGPGWGPWPGGAAYLRTFAPLPRARPLDLRVPEAVRSRLRRETTGTVALQGEGGLVVLPVSWRRVGQEGAYEAILPAGDLGLTGAGPDAPAALTVDQSSRWRASDMTGMLVQGTASLFSPEATKRGRRALLERLDGNAELALVRIRPRRIVWWEGWTSGAVQTRGRGRVAG